MGLITLFLVATGISYLGSLQLGPVNSEVIRFSMRGRKKDALLTGIGGALPEIPYALLAASLIQYLTLWPWMRQLFAGIFIIVILIMGFRLLLKKPKTIAPVSYQVKRSPFFIGFILATLNPQLIFFWSGILVGLGYQELEIPEMIAFSLGAAVGAFLLQYTAMQLGWRLFRSGRIKNLGLLDRGIGLFLIFLAIWVVIQEFL